MSNNYVNIISECGFASWMLFIVLCFMFFNSYFSIVACTIALIPTIGFTVEMLRCSKCRLI